MELDEEMSELQSLESAGLRKVDRAAEGYKRYETIDCLPEDIAEGMNDMLYEESGSWRFLCVLCTYWNDLPHEQRVVVLLERQDLPPQA